MAKIKVDDLIYDNNGTDATVDLTTAFNNLGKLVKVHHFEYNNRVAGSNGTTAANVNQFTWTSTFSPVDAANNLFLFTASLPVNSAGQDWSGYGLRVGSVDFNGYGVMYTDDAMSESHMSQYGYHFQVGGGVLSTAANQSIYHRTYSNHSQADQYFPNSNDDARVNAQTSGYLTIWEYKS